MEAANTKYTGVTIKWKRPMHETMYRVTENEQKSDNVTSTMYTNIFQYWYKGASVFHTTMMLD